MIHTHAHTHTHQLHDLGKEGGVFDVAPEETVSVWGEGGAKDTHTRAHTANRPHTLSPSQTLTFMNTPLANDAASLASVGVGAPPSAGVNVTVVAGVRLARRRK